MSLQTLFRKGAFAMPEENDSPWLLDKHKRGLQNLDRMRRYGKEDAVDLVVVGAGAGGVTLADSILAILRAVQSANTRFAAASDAAAGEAKKDDGSHVRIVAPSLSGERQAGSPSSRSRR